MKTIVLNLWESLKTNFWFLPGLIVISSIIISYFTIAVDKSFNANTYQLPEILFTGGAEGARAVLATIAGSMITIAGVTFSITIVALTLASSQFGPRLMRNFMKDQGNQVVLGIFNATFIYCLLILRSVDTTEKYTFVPNISTSFAVVLALINVCILIYFIHHISSSIQADHVISSVYKELMTSIDRLFPEELGYDVNQDEINAVNQVQQKNYQKSCGLAAKQSGYLQAINNEALMDKITTNDWLIRIHYRPGEFIVEGSTLVTLYCENELDDDTEKIIQSFIIGNKRTPEQDIEFSIHQLVEIAARALSPGINDPFTAITCIDRLGSVLGRLCHKKFPSARRCDDQGNLRIITKPFSFTGITNAAFDQIRQYSQSDAAVTIRLLEILKIIAKLSRNRQQRQALLKQAQMIERVSRQSLPDENDQKDMQERYQALLEALGPENE